MLKIQTRIGPSPIHGIGLFADQVVPAGTVIWEYMPRFDLAFAEGDLAGLSDPARDLVEKYSYYEAEIEAFVLCGDDARFINHSSTPNTEEHAGIRTVAARVIGPGEEITCDYSLLGKMLGKFRVEAGRNGAHAAAHS